MYYDILHAILPLYASEHNILIYEQGTNV